MRHTAARTAATLLRVNPRAALDRGAETPEQKARRRILFLRHS